MNGPFDGPYSGHVPTANTSLHNIGMDQMQMLMGVNTGAAIVKRQQQEEMAYLAALAVENANRGRLRKRKIKHVKPVAALAMA